MASASLSLSVGGQKPVKKAAFGGKWICEKEIAHNQTATVSDVYRTEKCSRGCAQVSVNFPWYCGEFARSSRTEFGSNERYSSSIDLLVKQVLL